MVSLVLVKERKRLRQKRSHDPHGLFTLPDG